MYLCIRNHATNMSNWCVSSAWLECLPVTQEVTGSSPVRTAKKRDFWSLFFVLIPSALQGTLHPFRELLPEHLC